MSRTVQLNVDYYDKAERTLFSKQSYSLDVDRIVKTGVDIPLEEFVGNGLLIEQKDIDRFRTRQDLADRIAGRWSVLTDYFELDGNGAMVSRFLGKHDTVSYYTETVGVASTISVLDSVFGTDQSDWQRIVITSDKDLDFTVSDGMRIIVAEAKGCVVADNSHKHDGVYKAKASIKAKKDASRPKYSSSNNDALIGVIAAIGNTQDQKIQCYLVDPPIQDVDDDPRRYRLLSRLRFYRDTLRLFSRGQLVRALTQRIADIDGLPRYDELNGKYFRNSAGERLVAPYESSGTLTHDAKNGFWGDAIAALPTGQVFFLGFLDRVAPMLIAQDFDVIMQHTEPPELTLDQEVEFVCNLRPNLEYREKSRSRGEKKDENLQREATRVRGHLASNSAGVVFGAVRPA